MFVSSQALEPSTTVLWTFVQPSYLVRAGAVAACSLSDERLLVNLCQNRELRRDHRDLLAALYLMRFLIRAECLSLFLEERGPCLCPSSSFFLRA